MNFIPNAPINHTHEAPVEDGPALQLHMIRKHNVNRYTLFLSSNYLFVRHNDMHTEDQFRKLVDRLSTPKLIELISQGDHPDHSKLLGELIERRDDGRLP